MKIHVIALVLLTTCFISCGKKHHIDKPQLWANDHHTEALYHSSLQIAPIYSDSPKFSCFYSVHRDTLARLATQINIANEIGSKGIKRGFKKSFQRSMRSIEQTLRFNMTEANKGFVDCDIPDFTP